MSRVKAAAMRAPASIEQATDLLAQLAKVVATIAAHDALRVSSKQEIDAAADACIVPLAAERDDIFKRLSLTSARAIVASSRSISCRIVAGRPMGACPCAVSAASSAASASRCSRISRRRRLGKRSQSVRRCSLAVLISASRWITACACDPSPTFFQGWARLSSTS